MIWKIRNRQVRFRALKRWHRWFAWYPVVVNKGITKDEVAWLCFVERKGVWFSGYSDSGFDWHYRRIGVNNG